MLLSDDGCVHPSTTRSGPARGSPLPFGRMGPGARRVLDTSHRCTMWKLMRLILWILFAPFRFFAWAFRVGYVRLRGYSVLRLRVHGHLPDRSGPLSLLRAWSGEARGPALLEVLLALDRARNDPRIRAIVIDLGPLHVGLARAEEVRRALSRARDSGKRVVVYLEQGGLPEYSVALGATEIVMPESGVLHLTGVASEVLLLKGLLDRVGIRTWLKARGRYKTARETFAETDMTPENREMTQALVTDLYEQLVDAVVAGRGLSRETAKEHLDRGPFTAAFAQELRLIDTIAYEDEAEKALEARIGKVRPVGLGSYFRLSERAIPRRPRATVGLLEVTGHIKSGTSVPGQNGSRATGSRRFVEEVRELSQDPSVDAVLLRVSSPGGSAVASDVMWHALDALREKKPIVVSMADVAASGGYFVSGIKGATIFASGATITGSIGVLGGKFDAASLYEKLGVKKEIVGAGAHAGYYSEARGLSEAEVERLEIEIEAHYRHFLGRMAKGRGKSVDEIHAVAEGRVFTGRRALENGLVDEEGGLLEALARVKALLGLSPEERVAIAAATAERRFFPVRVEWRVPESVLPDVLATPFSLAEWFRGERAFALLPFDFRIF